MGQKVNPIGLRVGVYRSWSARWFAPKNMYAQNVVEDLTIRKVLKEKLPRFDTVEVVIERTGDSVRVTLHSVNPGAVIGKKGQGIDSIKDLLFKKFGKKVEFLVKEVKNPDLSATAVASDIAQQIEKRVNFKKAMKKCGFSAIKAGARGIKIRASGRLGGAEIARCEWFRQGSTPLHTIRANIDYALVEAQTIYGKIGIQVWICKGMF